MNTILPVRGRSGEAAGLYCITAKPGERLPSRNELVVRFGLSHDAAKEIINGLMCRGVARRTRHGLVRLDDTTPVELLVLGTTSWDGRGRVPKPDPRYEFRIHWVTEGGNKRYRKFASLPRALANIQRRYADRGIKSRLEARPVGDWHERTVHYGGDDD